MNKTKKRQKEKREDNFGEKEAEKRNETRGQTKRETNLKDMSKIFLHWRFLVYVLKVESMRSKRHTQEFNAKGEGGLWM